MFIRGTEIKPEPPVTPVGMGKSTRGVELASVDDLDERQAPSFAGECRPRSPRRQGQLCRPFGGRFDGDTGNGG
jgi:hypothetical protein